MAKLRVDIGRFVLEAASWSYQFNGRIPTFVLCFRQQAAQVPDAKAPHESSARAQISPAGVVFCVFCIDPAGKLAVLPVG